jgi:hypothetical protein
MPSPFSPVIPNDSRGSFDAASLRVSGILRRHREGESQLPFYEHSKGEHLIPSRAATNPSFPVSGPGFFFLRVLQNVPNTDTRVDDIIELCI